jgi:hypothetical protein
MRKRNLKELLIVAILLISTAPLYAQRQQQDVAKLKADARNVVGTIANDKAKTQAYCQTLDLARQLERADQEKDRKKITVLSQKINQLQKLVGPEFLMLVNILKHLDLKSPDGREIALIIQSLNQSCPDAVLGRARHGHGLVQHVAGIGNGQDTVRQQEQAVRRIEQYVDRQNLVA